LGLCRRSVEDDLGQCRGENKMQGEAHGCSPISGVFVAKHRVMKLLENEVQTLRKRR
jgi:hypothetical protein